MEDSSDENIPISRYTLEELVKKGTISQKTYDKVKLGASIIEKKYYEKENQFSKHEKLDSTINNYLKNISYLSDLDKEEIKKIVYQKISKYNRLSRQKFDEKRFEIISEIGQGGFSRVKLCKDKITNELFAMKKLKLEILMNKAQLFHINTEKNILSLNNHDVEWKAKLNYSFIRSGYLYFIMDYYPGKDLLHYMNKKDTLTENEAKFYISEIILGVESLHKNNCIHRDIKPDNIFIDKDGHLKIGDFGLSILSSNITYPYTYKWVKKENNDNDIINKLMGLTNVGSLLYVAPEVIENKRYGAEIDWWSVGIIFYEMLVGFPPFWNNEDTPKETCSKLKNFKKYLRIPKGVKISEEAKKLIFDLLSERDKRLGKNGIEEIKNHIFFKNFDWDNIRKMKPPFVPEPFKYEKEKYHYIFMRKNSLQYYTSKENIKNDKIILELKQEKENSFKNRNFDYYDFYYNRELVELKYNIENNIIELIKKEIENYSKINNKSTNITLEETSTEEIASLKSNGSKSKNIQLSKSYYYSEKKNRNNYLFIAFDNTDLSRNIKSKLDKKKTIQIIPIRNLINSQNSVYKTLNKSPKKNSYYEPIYKRKYSNNIRNNINNNQSIEKQLIKNKKGFTKEKKINLNLNQNKGYKNLINDNKKKMKINGKLFVLNKKLGKYLLEQ